MVFSKAVFLASPSGRSVRMLLSGHLDILDGMKVEETEGEELGHINYEVDGEEYKLYPVMPEWCR